MSVENKGVAGKILKEYKNDNNVNRSRPISSTSAVKFKKCKKATVPLTTGDPVRLIRLEALIGS